MRLFWCNRLCKPWEFAWKCARVPLQLEEPCHKIILHNLLSSFFVSLQLPSHTPAVAVMLHLGHEV